MPDGFKIPFLRSKKEKLASDLVIAAKIAANDANKARTISGFIENYDIILDSFSKLSLLNGKVSNVKGDLTSEFCRLEYEFSKHLHDAIDRSGDEIVDESKGLYKHDRTHTLQRLNQFRCDIDRYSDRFDEQNKEFARAKFRFALYECNIVSSLGIDDLFGLAMSVVFETGIASASMLQRRLHLGYQRSVELIKQMEQAGIIGAQDAIMPRKILIEKSEWESKYFEFLIKESETHTVQSDEGLSHSTVISDIDKVDCMEGHKFECWCAEVLRKNGFVNVSVTQGSGDQGVDVLAEKDGVKYAIQCKCYSSDLGNKPVQEVCAGKIIYHCHVGVVMTNRFFTAGAKKAAEATGTLLWDRNKLIQLLGSSTEV